MSVAEYSKAWQTATPASVRSCQGTEWIVFNATSDAGRAALDALDAKVLRLHIGTHDVGSRSGLRLMYPEQVPYFKLAVSLASNILDQNSSCIRSSSKESKALRQANVKCFQLVSFPEIVVIVQL